MVDGTGVVQALVDESSLPSTYYLNTTHSTYHPTPTAAPARDPRRAGAVRGVGQRGAEGLFGPPPGAGGVGGMWVCVGGWMGVWVCGWVRACM